MRFTYDCSLRCEKELLYLQKQKTLLIMTALELNADIYRSLSNIADDESYLKKAASYLKRLSKKKDEEEEPVMTKEEIKQDLREALQELKLYREGKVQFKRWEDLYNELRD